MKAGEAAREWRGGLRGGLGSGGEGRGGEGRAGEGSPKGRRGEGRGGKSAGEGRKEEGRGGGGRAGERRPQAEVGRRLQKRSDGEEPPVRPANVGAMCGTGGRGGPASPSGGGRDPGDPGCAEPLSRVLSCRVRTPHGRPPLRALPAPSPRSHPLTTQTQRGAVRNPRVLVPRVFYVLKMLGPGRPAGSVGGALES